jgi:branched-subunit amino acid ABC-type transport system permease component
MKTRLGRMVRAVRDNPELVAAMGFNPRRVRWLIFSLGSGFAAVAAVLTSLDLGLNPHVGMNALLTAAVAVILGGIGRFRGAAVGALILGVLHSVVIWWVSAKWVDAVAFVALIGFLIYRTEGVFARSRRVEEATT